MKIERNKMLYFCFLGFNISKVHFGNNSRGISTVVSQAILISSVAAIGITADEWSQNTTASHEDSLGTQYSTAINKIRESLTLENFWYDTPHQKLNLVFKNTAEIGATITQIQIQGPNGQTYDITKASINPGGFYTTAIQYNWMGDPFDMYVTTTRGSIFNFHITAPTDGILIINKVSVLGNGNFSYNGDLGKFNITTTGYTPTAGLDKNGNLVLNGTIRDFNGTGYPDKSGKLYYPQGGHPDFEIPCSSFSGGCPYGIYTGIVLPNLGSDSKPVYNTTTNSPFNHGSGNFSEWYHDTPGVNIAKPLAITLIKQNTVPVTWKYTNNSFFPIDNQLWNCCGYDSNWVWHNYSFTYEIHNSFTYLGGETFSFTGDDDVWLFINHKLVIDLGGVHNGNNNPTINLDSLGLVRGNSYPFDFFYAERHTVSSEMTITTSIQLQNNGVGSTSAFFVDPGVYTVNEIVPNGWQLINRQCTNGYILPNSTDITISVPKGTTVCTFTNER